MSITPKIRLVEEDKDARLQNDVSYKKFATVHNPYITSATAGVAATASAFTTSAAAAAAANPYIGFNGGTPAWAARAAGWENGLMPGMFAPVATTVASTAGPSQHVQINPTTAAAVAAAEKAKTVPQVRLIFKCRLNEFSQTWLFISPISKAC